MKVIDQYIVKHEGTLQILFMCENQQCFVTSNGGFGQRDMYLEQIDLEEAAKLVDKMSTKINKNTW